MQPSFQFEYVWAWLSHPHRDRRACLYSVSDITSLKFKLGEPELGTRLHYQVAARHLQPTMATGGIDVMTARISEACEAGEKFTEVFYETMDKRRQVRGIVYRCF